MWYNGYNTLTYNCLFNFILGNRGCGKTYWSKTWAIKDFLKNGNQFIYLRRYKEELKKNKIFFNDILDDFKDVDFKVKNRDYYINDKIAGTALSLSTAKIEKSTSFPKVNKIIFDEFILDKGTYYYLPDEVINFLELYETVSRMRDVKVFFLSNAITIMNPYFSYFEIKLPYNSNIKHENDILIELVNNPDFIEAKEQTRFGKLIKNTKYGNYAINNQFLRDDNTFIEKKSSKSQYRFTIFYNDVYYGAWFDFQNGTMYLSYDYDKLTKNIYCVTKTDHSVNTYLIKSAKQNYHINSLLKAYEHGYLRFENIKIKGAFMEIIKLIWR